MKINVMDGRKKQFKMPVNIFLESVSEQLKMLTEAMIVTSIDFLTRVLQIL